ncbi:MAG: hypothetical protein HY826_01745 [Actinobacteria bacterium]|nr:hypothetical protein [Actinomycetota bacterium]
MKQFTCAPLQPAVADARARGALGLGYRWFDSALMSNGSVIFGSNKTTDTNLTARRLGVRTT